MYNIEFTGTFPRPGSDKCGAADSTPTSIFTIAWQLSFGGEHDRSDYPIYGALFYSVQVCDRVNDFPDSGCSLYTADPNILSGFDPNFGPFFREHSFASPWK